MIKEYTPMEWDVYGKVMQTKEVSVGDFAERNNTTTAEVLRIVKMWRKDQPDLFKGYDSEKEAMRGHVGLARRRKENIEIQSYDSAKQTDGNPYDDKIQDKTLLRTPYNE